MPLLLLDERWQPIVQTLILCYGIDVKPVGRPDKCRSR